MFQWKRVLFPALFLCLFALCVFLPLWALAQSLNQTDAAYALTPEAFAVFTGQVMFVLLAVQLIKLPIDQKIAKVKTEYIVYGVALIAQVLAQFLLYGLPGFTLAFLPKCIAFAFLTAVTAKEVYIKAIGNVEAKKAALKGISVERDENTLKA